MRTIILLVTVSVIYLLIYLTVSVKPEWFIGNDTHGGAKNRHGESESSNRDRKPTTF